MLNLLFSPNGQIGSSEMLKGGLILIIIGALLSLAPVLGASESLTMILGLVGYILIIPWIFLWMKRYRDGGKSPAMCLLPIGVYIVLSIIVVMTVVGGEVFGAAMEAAQSGASSAETEQAVAEAMGDPSQLALKGTIASSIVSLLVLFGFNALIKHDPAA